MEEEKQSLNTKDFVDILAERANFTKKDIKIILVEMRDILEECIKNDMDVNVQGLFHLSVKKVDYEKPTGIIGYHNQKDFKKKIKVVRYKVPLNFRNLVKDEKITD